MTTRRSARKVEPTIAKKKQSQRERAGLCIPPYAVEHRFRAKMGHKKSLARTAPVFVAGAAEALIKSLLEDALALAGGDRHRIMVRHLVKPLADSGKVYGRLLPSRVENVRTIDVTKQADADAYKKQKQEEAEEAAADAEAMDESSDADSDDGSNDASADDQDSE